MVRSKVSVREAALTAALCTTGVKPSATLRMPMKCHSPQPWAFLPRTATSYLFPPIRPVIS